MILRMTSFPEKVSCHSLGLSCQSICAAGVWWCPTAFEEKFHLNKDVHPDCFFLNCRVRWLWLWFYADHGLKTVTRAFHGYTTALGLHRVTICLLIIRDLPPQLQHCNHCTVMSPWEEMIPWAAHQRKGFSWTNRITTIATTGTGMVLKGGGET